MLKKCITEKSLLRLSRNMDEFIHDQHPCKSLYSVKYEICRFIFQCGLKWANSILIYYDSKIRTVFPASQDATSDKMHQIRYFSEFNKPLFKVVVKHISGSDKAIYSFIHLVVCLTTGPKPLPNRALHIVRSRASSFNCDYPLLSLRSSSSFLRFLPRLPVTSIPPFIFPSITRCRRQFLRRM